MSVTFRQIGARLKTQGGTSFNNLSVNNRLATAEPLVIIGNYSLYEALSTMLQADTTLLQNVKNPVNDIVLNESYDINYVISLIKPSLITDLLQKGTLVATIITEYLSDFAPVGVVLLKNYACFISELTRNLLPAGNDLLFSQIITSLQSFLILTLPFKLDFQNLFLSNLVPYMFARESFLNSVHNIDLQRVDYVYKKPLRVVVNDRVETTVFAFTIKNNYTCHFLLERTTFLPSTGNLIQQLFVTLKKTSDLSLLASGINVSFGSGGTSNFTSSGNNYIYSNRTGADLPVVFRAYFANQTLGGTVTISGYFSITQTLITQLDYSTNTDVITMPVTTVLPTSIYDGNKKLANIVSSSDIVLVQYKRAYPIWNLARQTMVNVVTTYRTATGLYIAANVTGPLTFYTPTAVVNIYSQGLPMFLAKMRSNGETEWAANIYSVNLSYTKVKGVTIDDATGNVYVFATHRGNPLYAYNANGTLFNTVISETSLSNLNNDNLVVIVYSSAGTVQKFTTIKNNFYADIHDVFIDNIANVYIAGSTNSTTKLSYRPFSAVSDNVIPVVFQAFVVPVVNNIDLKAYLGMACVTNTPPNYVVRSSTSVALHVTAKSYLVNSVTTLVRYVMFKFRNTIPCFVAFFQARTVSDPANDNTQTSLAASYEYTTAFRYVFFLFCQFQNLYLINSYAFIESSSFIDDLTQQMSSSFDVSNSNYITVRSATNLQYKQMINNTQNNYTLNLPFMEYDCTFLLKTAHETCALDTSYYAALSNSSVTNMYIQGSRLYVMISFSKLCTVYTLQSSVLNAVFSIGDNIRNGNAIIEFNLTTLVPTLLGFSLGL